MTVSTKQIFILKVKYCSFKDPKYEKGLWTYWKNNWSFPNCLGHQLFFTLIDLRSGANKIISRATNGSRTPLWTPLVLMLRSLKLTVFLSCLPLSPFLPSRPPRTPACCLRRPLRRAASTRRRTPPLTCRLRPQPAPTQVGVWKRLIFIFQLPLCLLRSEPWCFPLLSRSGLISPGVSVPVQVPGTEPQSMSQNLGQYWARLQWAPGECWWTEEEEKRRKRRKGM